MLMDYDLNNVVLSPRHPSGRSVGRWRHTMDVMRRTEYRDAVREYDMNYAGLDHARPHTMKKRIILIKQHVVLNVSCNTTRAPYPENQNPIPDCTRKLKARSIGTPQLGGGTLAKFSRIFQYRCPSDWKSCRTTRP